MSANNTELIEATMAVVRPLTDARLEPVVLPGGSHLKIHLSPLPIVARVVLLGGEAATPHWRGVCARELSVAAYLRDAGVPATRPTDLVPPGPHPVWHGWITLWELAEIDRDLVITAAELDEAQLAFANVMAGYPDALPVFEPWRPIAPCLAHLERIGGLAAPGLSSVVDSYRRLDPTVQALSGEDLVPAHGDGHPGNLLASGGTWLWCDFEDVCLAPRFWDVACAVAWTRLYDWHPSVTEELVARRLGGAPSNADTAEFDFALALRLIYLSIVGTALTPPGAPYEPVMREIARRSAALLPRLMQSANRVFDLAAGGVSPAANGS